MQAGRAHYSMLPVVEAGRCVGIVQRADVVRHMP
jgi:predicted transcriptional regulator